VRQDKLGASCRVRVPAGQELTTHPYRVLQVWRRRVDTDKPNERSEAYTGNHVGRKGDRTSLRSGTAPKGRFGDAGGDRLRLREAHAKESLR
jgi:hypothetical protein